MYDQKPGITVRAAKWMVETEWLTRNMRRDSLDSFKECQNIQANGLDSQVDSVKSQTKCRKTSTVI